MLLGYLAGRDFALFGGDDARRALQRLRRPRRKSFLQRGIKSYERFQQTRCLSDLSERQGLNALSVGDVWNDETQLRRQLRSNRIAKQSLRNSEWWMGPGSTT